MSHVLDGMSNVLVSIHAPAGGRQRPLLARTPGFARFDPRPHEGGERTVLS